MSLPGTLYMYIYIDSPFLNFSGILLLLIYQESDRYGEGQQALYASQSPVFSLF